MKAATAWTPGDCESVAADPLGPAETGAPTDGCGDSDENTGTRITGAHAAASRPMTRTTTDRVGPEDRFAHERRLRDRAPIGSTSES